MSTTDPELDRLRTALRALGEDARPGPDCPAPEHLWDAIAGESSVDERRALVDHTASCAACAEAWRLALEVRGVAVPGAALGESKARPLLARWPLALAAAVLLSVAAVLFLTRGPVETPATYREGGGETVRSLVPAEARLARDDFRLRWSSAEPGSRYSVRVTTESLETIAVAEDLEDAAFVVPSSALQPLPSGTRLLWQVQVRLEDGTRRTSSTFVTALR